MIAWFFFNLALATLLMLVVLAVRRPFAGLFGAGPVYALWLLPALRLVTPPLPSFAPDIPSLLPPQTLIVWAGDAAAPMPPDGGPGQWVPLLLAIWAIGAAAFLIWQWRAYRRFVAALGLSSRGLGAHRGLRLVESAAAQGPLALGLLDRRIVVPADFETRYAPQERRLALDHEAVHHRRGDIWWNHVGLTILALNWFNPVAWIAFRAFRADQELACDAAVAASASADARHDYARALIKSASRPGLVAACPLNHADQLKRRLKMMKDHKSSRARFLGGAAAIILLAGVSLAVGGPGFAQPGGATQDQAQPREERHEQRVIVRTNRTEGGAGGEARERTGRTERTERVIVMNHGEDDHADHVEHRVRVRPGDGGELDAANCEGGQATNVDESTDGQRTRIILCSRGEATSAQRVERLQRVRDRLANDSELSEAQRAQVTAAMDREIARLRAQ